jgi:hypothetical protein
MGVRAEACKVFASEAINGYGWIDNGVGKSDVGGANDHIYLKDG